MTKEEQAIREREAKNAAMPTQQQAIEYIYRKKYIGSGQIEYNAIKNVLGKEAQHWAFMLNEVEEQKKRAKRNGSTRSFTAVEKLNIETWKQQLSDYKDFLKYKPHNTPPAKPEPKAATAKPEAAASAKVWTGSKKPAIKTAKDTDKAKATGKAFTAAKPKPAAKPTKQPKPKPAAKPKAKPKNTEPQPPTKRVENKIATREKRVTKTQDELAQLKKELEYLQRQQKIVKI